MFESLIDLVTSSDWVYLLILLVAAVDAVFPLVPSEATVIAAGALAGAGELTLSLVLLAGAAGAVLGDNAGFLIGRLAHGPLNARLHRSRRLAPRLAWAEERLRRRGGTIIVVSRFVPGGRTATMLAAGLLRFPWRRFAAFDLLAGVFWAGYAGLLGFFGGMAFRDQPAYALLLAFALAGAVALLAETARRVARSRRGPVTQTDPRTD